MEVSYLFKARLEQFEKTGKQIRKKITRIAFLRLVVMVLAGFFLYLAISNEIIILYSLSVLLFILFFSLVIYHRNLNDQFKKNLELIRLNETELRVLNNDFSFLPDGSEFINPAHDFSHDLDIFGKNSVFQYINRSCTSSGKQKLAALLCTPELSGAKIIDKQMRYKELSGGLDFLQDFLSTGSLVSETDEETKELITWASENNKIFPSWLNTLTIITAILSVVILLGSIAGIALMKYLIPIASLNWIIYGFYGIRINRYHQQTSRKSDLIRKILELNRIIAAKEFKHPDLSRIQKTAKDSLRQINKLNKLMDFLDQRLNMLIGVILNTLFLYDFHLIRSLEKWKSQNAGRIPLWLDVPPTFDCWISLANFIITHPDFSFPEPVENGISAISLSHPLISSSVRISNDFTVQTVEKLFIVTGANMAGKSTFLRTLGINLQLAMAGLPVCAEKLKFTPMEIFSSMRTNDSLGENESYFFAELKRLKSIIDKLKSGKTLFIMLDEILKGTNTTDKHKGSVAFIEQLIKYPCMTIIATHDLNLATMEKEYPAEIKNYCFESYVEGTELIFNYKISPGIAQNMNATFLMERMGIIRDGLMC